MIRSRNRGLVCVVGFAALTLACHAAEPFEGRWEGIVHIPGNEFNVVIDLAPGHNGAWSGSIIIPELNTKGLPLKEVTINGADATFAIKTAPIRGLEATLKAHLKQDKGLTGEFIQGGNTAPFELKHAGPPQVEFSRQSTAISKQIEGEWKGEFQLLGYPRKVTLKFANKENGAVAEFVVIGKRVNNLPVDLVTQQADLIDVRSQETGARFEGKFRKETGELSGAFSQGPFEVPLVLKKTQPSNDANSGQSSTANAPSQSEKRSTSHSQ